MKKLIFHSQLNARNLQGSNLYYIYIVVVRVGIIDQSDCHQTRALEGLYWTELHDSNKTCPAV